VLRDRSAREDNLSVILNEVKDLGWHFDTLAGILIPSGVLRDPPSGRQNDIFM